MNLYARDLNLEFCILIDLHFNRNLEFKPSPSINVLKSQKFVCFCTNCAGLEPREDP
jgi:hypothetical protein